MVNSSCSTKWLCGLLAIGTLIVARSAAAEEAKPNKPNRPARIEAGQPLATLGDAKQPTEFIDATTITLPAQELVLIGTIKTELEETKAELAKTKAIIGDVIQEQRLVAESKELPPLKDAEVRVFQLKNTKAADAAEKVELLFGAEPLRIAVDDASNGLIVFGKAEAIPQVEQVIIKLDELAVADTEGFTPLNINRQVVAAPATSRRSLLLRVFWLADGVQEAAGAEEYLPPAVIRSLARLGLQGPRLVTQTVTSLSAEEGGMPAEFSTEIPAILFEQPVSLSCSGNLGVMTDNRAEVDMKLTVGGSGVNCDLKGSLATPLGHYMVLGTANSVVPQYDTAGGGGSGMPMGRGGMGMARSGEMAMGGEGFGAAAPAPAKYHASRFAFVVQVIEGESFAAEEGE